MKLILNADDFGLDPETVEATIACFAEGALTSATIMPTAPAVSAAVEFARGHPEFSFGVHLTFTGDGSERPLCEPGEISGLVDETGSLRRTRELRIQALLGRLSVSEIAREMTAQIAFVRSHDVPVSHVDSHRHLHKLGPFRGALRRVLPQFAIRRVRTAQDVYLGRPMTNATYWLGKRWGGSLRANFVSTDHFYMPSSTGDVDWSTQLIGRMGRLRGNTLEVGVHPGIEGWRSAERRAVMEFAALARHGGHELVAWTAIQSTRTEGG